MKIRSLVVPCLCALVVCAPSAFASYDLQISEIWPGNEPGSNLSEDWFEITNYGDMAWTAAVDGDLYYDDDSFDASTADIISGVASIAPGESVILVNGGASAATDWSTLWGAVVTLPQVGSFDGSGLGQGGDAVGVWVSMGAPAGAPNFTAAYPDANSNGGQSYDTILSAFSTVSNAAGAVATTTLNDVNQPAIGSPGSVVPEPGTLALAMGGMWFVVRRKRTQR